MTDYNSTFETKFNFLVEKMEKEEENSQDRDAIINKLKSFSDILLKSVQSSCKDKQDKIMIFAEIPKSSDKIDSIKPIIGHENDFLNAKNDYNNCIEIYKTISDTLNYEIEILNLLGLHSYTLCLDQCKTEVKENKSNEKNAQNCISTCLKYKNINSNAAYELIMNDIEESKKHLNKI
jgi:hypothetical protein